MIQQFSDSAIQLPLKLLLLSKEASNHHKSFPSSLLSSSMSQELSHYFLFNSIPSIPINSMTTHKRHKSSSNKKKTSLMIFPANNEVGLMPYLYSYLIEKRKLFTCSFLEELFYSSQTKSKVCSESIRDGGKLFHGGSWKTFKLNFHEHRSIIGKRVNFNFRC
jgi:hypothetical protein